MLSTGDLSPAHITVFLCIEQLNTACLELLCNMNALLFFYLFLFFLHFVQLNLKLFLVCVMKV